MTLIAALSLFGLLVLAAAVATAVLVHGDGYGRAPAPEEPPWRDGDLPSAPYRDAPGARPW